MRLSIRVRIIGVAVCLALAATVAPAIAAAPPAQDVVFETWVVHLTGGDATRDQGRVWLRETPCQQGFFFMLVAPAVRDTADHAVIFVDGRELVTIPGEKLGFAIVLDEWPAEGFGDPSPAYVGWGADDPSPEAIYEVQRSGAVTVGIYDAAGTELLMGCDR